MTADIVAAYVSGNHCTHQQLYELIPRVYGTIRDFRKKPAPTAKPIDPAHPPKNSAKRKYIVCLDCGGRFQMLKKHGSIRELQAWRWALAEMEPPQMVVRTFGGGAAGSS